MLLPIYAYGHPVLKKIAADIDPNYPDLTVLIENMWQTMYEANGVGLAAPQIGASIRLFMVDTLQLEKKEPDFEGFKRIFINAQKINELGKPWSYEEGCLSIPNVRGEVHRQPILRMKWLDENFIQHEAEFNGMNARVIQHEYDHIDGVLFTDKLSPVKKSLIRNKLENIRKGKVTSEYKMRFVK